MRRKRHTSSTWLYVSSRSLLAQQRFTHELHLVILFEVLNDVVQVHVVGDFPLVKLYVALALHVSGSVSVALRNKVAI